MKQVARSGLLFLFAAVALIASSCRRDPPSNVDRNRAPETYITRAPAESTLSYYRVHLYWNGEDPDGKVAYYEIAVTDTNEVPGQDLEEGTGYTRTLKTDSLFTLRADPPIEQQILGHRFYVRAVDNEGKIDPTPALAYFVARDDYYPEVTFPPGHSYATWDDACGNHYRRELNGVTDTVGVEACAHWTWSGQDFDASGHIIGFEWKMASETQSHGGTLSDTVAALCFPPNASRRQTVQIRGIDDAGLKSLDPFLQDLILNFDPLTFVLHPTDTNPDGTPKHEKVFNENGVIWQSGTTLPDGANGHNVDIIFTGIDDPRDKQVTCGEKGVHKYRSRELFRDDSFGTPAGSPFEIIPDALLPYPDINTKSFLDLKSGDHFILIQAVDDYLVVDSTPETVLVKVNYSPYVTYLKIAPGRSTTHADSIDVLAIRNSSLSNPIEIHLAEGESLDVKVKGRDIHLPNPLNPPPPATPDPLAAAFDSAAVVAQELGHINVVEGYRVFFESVIEPGYEPTPGLNPENPYTTSLEVTRPGIYKLIADVHDESVQALGRRGRIVRYIKVVR